MTQHTSNIIMRAAAGVVILALLAGIGIAYRTKTRIHAIFQLNQARKSEGYYLAEFEFKLLGAAYDLDHGQYLTALSRLETFHTQLSTTEGLIKIPAFANAHDKLEFYQRLQNPKTGAFMDDAYPLFTYFGVTSNMIAFLEELAREAHEPFRLNVPLTFLDDIRTPETLAALLDDLAAVGWFGAKFKTPYVEIGELWSLAQDAERLGLYAFSPEWKRAYLQWVYDNQDGETGLWGSRSRRTGKLLDGGNLTDSEKMISKFLDSDGNTISPDFPLRYRAQMFASALEKLAAPMPDDLDQRHEWILDHDRGIRFLTRYLWNTATDSEKDAARQQIEAFVRLRFEHYYVDHEGAFSLYPQAEHADLDGTGEALGMYKYIGAFAPERQQRLWGDPQEQVVDLGTHAVAEITAADVAVITQQAGLNSLRFYAHDPAGRYLEHVERVVYPSKTSVLDIMEVLPKVEHWITTTPQNMGNWVTKENLLQEILHIEPVPVSYEIPLEEANAILRRQATLIIVGFDVLQAPRYALAYHLH